MKVIFYLLLMDALVMHGLVSFWADDGGIGFQVHNLGGYYWEDGE